MSARKAKNLAVPGTRARGGNIICLVGIQFHFFYQARDYIEKKQLLDEDWDDLGKVPLSQLLSDLSPFCFRV